ncbi:MAG TPA: hypothetical protein VG053_08805 [Solirubrobacteraceae bacterium]|jgi:hypothetical protein|nr:hypothetical protein [Solirubrobacteraceae bacterium]
MGKRSRRRAAGSGGAPRKLTAPTSEYTDADGATLTLRGALTVAARREYADALAGVGNRASTTREDAWQRAVELLFERLAVSWTIAGAPIAGQRELLARYRAASQPERAWIREVLREHCAESFPDVQAP